MLAFYAATLPCVEVNQTFYRMPKRAVLEGWAAQVPEGFRFALKASRRITHLKRLRDVGERRPSSSARRRPSVRGSAPPRPDPPNLARDLERLDAFLALLPEGTRAAFELRHPSWAERDRLRRRLRERRFAWVAADVDDAPPPALVATAPLAYVRLGARPTAPRTSRAGSTPCAPRPSPRPSIFFKHEGRRARLPPRARAPRPRECGARR